MREEHTIRLAEIPIGGKDGFLWNRLHGEREEICEALVKEEIEARRRTLQARLRRIDDDLDRLMSGSYKSEAESREQLRCFALMMV